MALRKHYVPLKPLQAWALVTSRGNVQGGEYRCAIFWTRSGAKEAQPKFPECDIVRVVVNQVFP